MAGDARAAAGRARERAQHVDRRRLAGAVGPEEAEHLAARDLEADAAHRLDLPEGLLRARRPRLPDSCCHSNITVNGFSRGIARAQEASDPGDDPGPGDGPLHRARLRLRHGRRRRARGRRLGEDGVQLLPGQGGPRLQPGPSPPRRAHRRDPHPPARHLARGAVPPADRRAHRPRGARRGSADRGDPAAGGRQPRPARAPVHRLGARGRGADAGDRGGDGRARPTTSSPPSSRARWRGRTGSSSARPSTA